MPSSLSAILTLRINGVSKMKINQKKGIWVSDILLIIITCSLLVFFIYQIVTAETLINSVGHCLFLIATALFIFRGYLLNKLRKRRDNLKELNFFEYYEEELDMMMKYKVINMQLFLPILKREKKKELDKFRQKTNILVLVMYALIITSIFIK
jgi:hypothetical protein